MRSKDKPPESIARMARIYRAYMKGGDTDKTKISNMAEKHPVSFSGFDDFIKLKGRKTKDAPKSAAKKKSGKKKSSKDTATGAAETGKEV